MMGCIKKILIIFLVICIIVSNINISAFQVFATEGETVEQNNETEEKIFSNDKEDEENKEEEKEEKEEKEEIEQKDEQEEKTDNTDEKQEEQEKNKQEETETKENIIEESENVKNVKKNKKKANRINNGITAIYLNGKNGNDDDNDGLSESAAVKTFGKVKAILSDNENIDTVYILGTVSITGDETWELPKGVTVKRKVADQKLVEVDENAKLTLKNIVLDGQKDIYTSNDKSSLIYVEAGGLLTIEDGTKLTNNNAGDYTQLSGGGAIYSRGKVIMNGGEISENISYQGGGIVLDNDGAELILNDGLITSNVADNARNEAIGGGIFAYLGGKIIMNGGEISNNSIGDKNYGRGGGIGVSTFKKENIGTDFVMNGGIISDNESVSGAGIYVECGTKAELVKGTIKNNRCVVKQDSTSGQYGGAGIYVNGGKSSYYPDGYLHISSAYISGNEAKKYDGEGSGIAGCGTSTVTIHENAATICGNEGKSQVYIDRYVNPAAVAQGGDTARSKVNIALHSLGGYANHWESEEGKEVSSSDLKGEIPEGSEVSITDNAITSLEKTKNLANVIITDNVSDTRGGGIGTNGEIEIGDDPILIEGNVTKQWLDSNAKDGIRPESIVVNLYANGILIDSVKISEATNWKYKFENLVLADKYDNEIKYTIEEVLPNGYKANINDNDIKDSTITNTQVISLDVTKKWKDDNNKYGTRSDSITVKLYANGKFVRSQKITKKDGWKYTFKDLAKYDENGKEIKYTVLEEKVKEYETTIDGTNITNTHIMKKKRPQVKPPKTGGIIIRKTMPQKNNYIFISQLLIVMLLVAASYKVIKRIESGSLVTKSNRKDNSRNNSIKSKFNYWKNNNKYDIVNYIVNLKNKRKRKI